MMATRTFCSAGVLALATIIGSVARDEMTRRGVASPIFCSPPADRRRGRTGHCSAASLFGRNPVRCGFRAALTLRIATSASPRRPISICHGSSPQAAT
jgi:hypothetical protein